MGKPRIDLTGKRFGDLTCIEYAGEKKWLVECRCGLRREIVAASLKINRYVCRHLMVDRFWEKVSRSEFCWNWTGAVGTNGYARFNFGRPAHRYAWELHHGPIPSGMHIDHLCRNRSCVRPDHLELVTNLENRRRGLNSPTTNAPFLALAARLRGEAP